MLPSLRRLSLTLPLLVALALPGAAHAGTYHVYSCKTPNQQIAPTDGWTAIQQGGAFSSPTNNCPMGTGMYAFLSGDFSQAPSDRLGWTFAVPADLELAGFSLYRYYTVTAYSEVNATPVDYVAFPGPEFAPDGKDLCIAGAGCREVGTAGSSAVAADLYREDNLDGVRNVYVYASCGGSSSCVDRNSSTPMASILIKAFEARLRDQQAPVATGVTGPLASGAVHRGEESLSFNATDVGSGVYRTVVELRREATNDWAPIATAVVDDNGGYCRDITPDSGDPYEFVKRVPCKTQVGGGVTLDTRTIPNGAHELRISVEDASGNRAPLAGPMPFKVSNPTTGASGNGILGTPTNGLGASNQVRIVISKATRRARKLRFGQRMKLVATVRNELGKPVPGAQVDLLQRVKRPGARFTVVRRPMRTGPLGKVRWTVPAGQSRRLRLAYKANLLNTSYQSFTDISLEVAAATSLHRDHRSYRNGETIRFTGRVRSKPIPKGGVLIDLQAYKRGTGWVTFATRRSGTRGRWSIGYRFTSTLATTRYRFRARIRQDSGYPYSAGKTKPMSVLVRP